MGKQKRGEESNDSPMTQFLNKPFAFNEIHNKFRLNHDIHAVRNAIKYEACKFNSYSYTSSISHKF